MIYITGDMHGDQKRFRAKEMRKLRKNDTLIVCGDFGFVWDGSVTEKRVLRWIGKRKYDVLFVEGVHDNLDLLEEYPVEEWGGGRVRAISGRLRQLMRGEVYEIEGKTLFAFGGGELCDHDVELSWSGRLLPNQEEIGRARENLRRAGRVDFIVTHQPSRKIRSFLRMDDNEINMLDAFLDEVRERCEYRRWYFGSVHANKPIPPAEMAVFQDVVKAE